MSASCAIWIQEGYIFSLMSLYLIGFIAQCGVDTHMMSFRFLFCFRFYFVSSPEQRFNNLAPSQFNLLSSAGMVLHNSDLHAVQLRWEWEIIMG